jgi:hypothetical protein
MSTSKILAANVNLHAIMFCERAMREKSPTPRLGNSVQRGFQ